jgi:putative transposase
MARIAVFVVPKFSRHVTSRGNRRQIAFFRADEYAYYLVLLDEYSKVHGAENSAYCSTTNRVHMVMVTSEEDSLRATLGETHRRYTRHIDFRTGWRRHYWKKRLHSFVMDDSNLMATVRYVKLYSVTARLCRRAQEWMWPSA